jgi:hypothetical protein
MNNPHATDRNGTANHAEAVELLAPHWPAEGRRHAAFQALAGGLLRDRLSVEAVESLTAALGEATGYDQTDKEVAAVRTTAAKLKSPGKPVTGWPRLLALLGDGGAGAVGAFRRRLGLTICLQDLADCKRLPVEFLREQGLHDLPEGGVGAPYRDGGGKTIAVKRRTALVAKDGSAWPAGKPVIPYGEDRLSDATEAGHLTLVEGETDALTLWYHGFPALGLPGADTVKALQAGHLAAQAIYVVQEPDESGAAFVANVRSRLGELGFGGTLKVVRLGGAKDPSELHLRGPDDFPRLWREALEKAGAVGTAVPAAPAAAARAGPPWPSPLAEEALHGLAGDVVRVLGPASEADPAALLLQVLVGLGSVIGRTAHFRVEDDLHYGNEFLVLVGKTSKARKGTSWGRVRRLLEGAEAQWAAERVQTGLSSGEGLIWGVRDPVMKSERVKEKGQPVRYEQVEADPGLSDKRLLVLEPEYANVLKQTERQGNTLSAVLRQAWESGDLRSLTKNSPARATGAHVSLVGHVTGEELRRYLTTTEMANGFGNRHLWACVRRSKQLPEGARVDGDSLAGLQRRLAAVLGAAAHLGEVGRDEEAREIWREVYGHLSADRPGLTGAMLGRAEAHVLRLSMLYAVLDCSGEVQAPHLMAALAVWAYCEQSVRHVFGDALGDPVADELIRLLRVAADGMSRWELYAALGRHQSSERTGHALALLAEHGLAQSEKRQTGGRPEERWFATGR